MRLSDTFLETELVDKLRKFNIRRVEQIRGILSNAQYLYSLSRVSGREISELRDTFNKVLKEYPEVNVSDPGLKVEGGKGLSLKKH